MILKTFKHIFFWLSGAGAETLEQCPNWEQRKYVAFGATILVPTVFAFIACAYAVSTLTDNWRIIIPVAAAWGVVPSLRMATARAVSADLWWGTHAHAR